MTSVDALDSRKTRTGLSDMLRTFEKMMMLESTRKGWQILCGEGFPLIEPLLQPMGKITDYMPCMDPYLGLHYHEVMEFSNGTTLAVFADEDYDCPSFPVERWERTVLSPDMDVLAIKICEALGLEHRVISRPGGTAIDSHPVYEIGCYHPLESYEFPVVISFHPDASGTEEALFMCAAAFDGPFIFLTATPKESLTRIGAVVNKRPVLLSSPPAYNRTFIIKRLAYRIQELAYGGLSEETHAKMREILDAHGFDENACDLTVRQTRREKMRRAETPVTGTRLVREWNGRRYEVIVVSGGFEYEGRLYRSLTAITKVITGTHWNGRAFFGLRNHNRKKGART